MYEQVEKPKENKSRAVANSVSQKKSSDKQSFGFVDNRSEAVAQRKQFANTNAHEVVQRKLNDLIHSDSKIIQRYKKYGADEAYPEGSVKASKTEIFNWLNGAASWSNGATNWCLVGGSAHVEIVEHLLSSNFDGVVNALVVAMKAVPPQDQESKAAYIDFFVDEVMTTEDLDIAVSDSSVADQFPINQAGVPRLLCPEYSKPGVDLIKDGGAKKIRLPNGVWVSAPNSLIGKDLSGMPAMLAEINARKADKLDGKGRKRKARNELMGSVIEQGLLGLEEEGSEK